MRRRLLLAALPVGLGAARVRAADAGAPATRYVMMSLVGDQVTYVQRAGANVGTHLDPVMHEERPMAGAPFDITALQVMAAAVPKAVPGAAMSFLKGTLPEYFSDQVDWFDGDTLKLPDKLRGAVLGEHADVLLLLTKWRGEASISDGHSAGGTGKIAGLGFYSDASARMRGADEYGFSAPYVYATLSLVDLSTMRRLRERTIRASRLRPFGSFRLGDLQDTLVDGLQDAVATVLAPA